MTTASTLEKASELDWRNRSLPMPDSADLRAAISGANVQTMLMVYVHLTHDEEFLEEFRPFFRPPFSVPSSEVPPEKQAELEKRLLHVLTTPGAARIDQPSERLMQKMMTVGVGERVEDEFVPMVLEQAGFQRAPARRELPARKAPPADHKVLVIGAGFTGMNAGIELDRAGYDYVIIEKNADAGGTWHLNRYPGVGVDTPSLFYSLSFEVTPEWSHFYPKGADMQKYLLSVVEKYNLREKIRFNTTVTKLVYDEDAAMWDVTLNKADGSEEVLRVNAIINAHGPLSRWKLPNIPGLDNFKGVVMHTATWKPDVELVGKRVAVIGTGASAVQLVPAIAGDVSDLVVFMRRKHWVVNNPEVMAPITDEMRFALRHIPYFREWFRFRVSWQAGDTHYQNVLLDPDWPTDLPSVSEHNESIRQYAMSYLKSKLQGRPDLLEKLTPDTPVFSKRPIMDSGWLDALKRENVTLENGAIESVTEHGISMADGTHYDVDVIACATGFDVANMLGDLTIIGRDGRSLRDEWGMDDPRSYMGIMVPGYPNYFMTIGANSGPTHAGGHNVVSEAQVHYIIECLDMISAEDKAVIETTVQAFKNWNEIIDRHMKRMIWSHPKAEGYLINSKGRNFLSWPFRLVDYWNQMRSPIKSDYILQ